MAHDHFAQLDPSDTSVIDAEHQEYSHQQQSASHGHEQQPGETEDDADLSFNDDPDGRPAKKKMRLPIPVLLGGGFIVFIALFAGYKKIVGHPAHPSSVPSAVASLPADDGSGNGNGGMMAPHGQAGPGSVASLPAFPTVTQAAPAPLTAADLGSASSTSIASLPAQATSVPATSAVPAAPNALPAAVQAQRDSALASATQVASNSAHSATMNLATTDASATSTIMSAAAVPASAAEAAPVDPRDAKIAKLERELSQLRGKRPALARAKHVASAKSDETGTDAASTESDANSDSTDQQVRHASAKAPRKGKHSRVLETQVGWHIKQVIPGQGWVEDENSGKQVVVSIGDRIGGAEVTKIDADGGKIYTTAGVIQ